nr:ATP-binding cassette domain-containing protein [Rhodococcus opacus]
MIFHLATHEALQNEALGPTTPLLGCAYGDPQIGFDSVRWSNALRTALATPRSINGCRDASILGLEKYLDRRPKALSGGQRQRVAMGRAIVRDPSEFLMDEPLSNLDAKLRVETRANIAGLQNRLGTTMVYVTHDQIEAMTMGDRVAVLKDGVLQQVDSPRDIYLRTWNAFVAGFIGSPAMNLRPGKVLADRVLLDNASFAVDRRVVSESESSDVLVGIRPESLVPAHCDGSRRLEVIPVEQLGADAFVHGTLDGDSLGDKVFVVRCDSRTPPRIGETLHVTTTPDELHIFDTVTGRRLSQPCSIAARIESLWVTMLFCRATNSGIRDRRAQPIHRSSSMIASSCRIWNTNRRDSLSSRRGAGRGPRVRSAAASPPACRSGSADSSAAPTCCS